MIQLEKMRYCLAAIAVSSLGLIVAVQIPPLPKAVIQPTLPAVTAVYWNTCSSETNWFFYGVASGSYTGKQLLTTTAKLRGTNAALLTNLIYGQKYYGVLRSTFDNKEFSPLWNEVTWIAGFTNHVTTIEVSWPGRMDELYSLQMQGPGLPKPWHTVLTQKGFGSNITFIDGDIRGNRLYRVSSTNERPKLSITTKQRHD